MGSAVMLLDKVIRIYKKMDKIIIHKDVQKV